MRKLLLFLTILILLLSLSSCELFYKPQKGKLFVITMGSTFSNTPDRKLYATVNDAIQVGNAFKELAEKADVEIEVHYLVDKVDGAYRYGESYSQLIIPQYDEKSTYSTPSTDSFTQTLSDIREEASENDTIIIFFSTHGEGFKRQNIAYGATVSSATNIMFRYKADSTYEKMSVTSFLNSLDSVPGKKVILGDFCYSGALVATGGVTANSTVYPDQDLLSLLLSSDKITQSSSIFALSAATYFQESHEESSRIQGKFTKALLDSLGWQDESQSLSSVIPASKKNKISLSSIAKYIYRNDNHGAQQPVLSGGSNDIILFSF